MPTGISTENALIAIALIRAVLNEDSSAEDLRAVANAALASRNDALQVMVYLAAQFAELLPDTAPVRLGGLQPAEVLDMMIESRVEDRS